MKSIILVSVLAVLCVCVSGEDSAVEEQLSGRYNLILGSIGNGNRLLHRNTYTRQPKQNTIQWQELTYRGASNVRITCLRVVEVGQSQLASAWLLAGGISYSHVKFRMQTAKGRGYRYNVEIWGRVV